MVRKKNTILALSTPPGRSALATIRISGDLSYGCVKKISSNMPKLPNKATINQIKSKKGEVIDQTITTYFKSPKSFTGEDMVELSVHGGAAVVRKTISTILKNNKIRIAYPGEFTRRAFENNKLDLTQVEAIADLVNAETEMQRKQAVSHLSGDFFKLSKSIFENTKKTLADIEAIIDFSEEDLPKNLFKKIKEQTENNIKEIKKILKNAYLGMSIRDGFLVAILGKPNTGKSSFINNISGRDIAIVTDQPGTTRDLIESFVDIDGYPIKFVDTAGIRKTKNKVEKIGVERAYLASKEANFNIVFIEKTNEIQDFEFLNNAIFVKSKQDISGKNYKDNGFYNISSKTSFGIKKILSNIKRKISKTTQKESIYISRERHLKCLEKAIINLEKSKENKNIDLRAEDIRIALKNLSSLFGGVDIEDILDIIFTDFCIGK